LAVRRPPTCSQWLVALTLSYLQLQLPPYAQSPLSTRPSPRSGSPRSQGQPPVLHCRHGRGLPWKFPSCLCAPTDTDHQLISSQRGLPSLSSLTAGREVGCADASLLIPLPVSKLPPCCFSDPAAPLKSQSQSSEADVMSSSLIQEEKRDLWNQGRTEGR
jgi:hypothetical protein